MNDAFDLEHEHLANLRRTKLAERRRARALAIVAAALGVPVYVGLELARGRDVRALGDIVWAAAPFAIFPAVAAANRVRKRWADRGVVDTTSSRERLCRDSPLPMVPTRTSRCRRALAAAPYVVVSVAYCGWQFGWRGALGARLACAALVSALVALGLVARKAYAAWRARRDARRDVAWERWLDSADSCEVRPREWTK